MGSRSGVAALLLTGLLLAGPAGAATPVETVAALPQELGAFRRSGPPTDFEGRPGGAGLGASVRYLPAGGGRAVATVTVYDRGRARRPEGGDGADVAEELRVAATEVEQLVRLGRYRSAAFEPGTPARAPGGPLCATFRLVQQDGAPTGDGACVTVRDGRFVKLRLTQWDPPDPAAAGRSAAALLALVLEAQGSNAGPRKMSAARR